MTNGDHADHIEQALNSLRDNPVPAGPPADAVNRTLEQLRAMDGAADPPRALNESRLWRFGRSRAALAAGTLLVAMAAWVGVMGLPGTVAFADVQQQVKQAKTVRYVDTRLVDLAADELEVLREMSRNGNEAGSGRRHLALGNAHQPQMITIRGPHLKRTEVLGSDGTIESIEISNLSEGKHVTLFPKQKKMVDYTAQVTIEFESGKKSEEALKPAPEVDLIANIREIPANATTRLPERSIGGKRVTGFFSRETTPTTGGTETWERTYWVDPETKLPVRVEVSYHSTDKRIGRSDWVLSGFVFDEDVPEIEFSTELPTGYSQESQKVYGIQVE